MLRHEVFAETKSPQKRFFVENVIHEKNWNNFEVPHWKTITQFSPANSRALQTVTNQKLYIHDEVV
jgi:hypothetical protein